MYWHMCTCRSIRLYTVLRKFLIVGENYCGRNVYEIANRRVKFLADISGYTVVLTTLRPQNFRGSSQPRKHFKGAVRRVAHAHYDTYVIMKPDSRPDGTAIRDHVLHAIHARAVLDAMARHGDGRSYG